jgi:hypothetical protein
MTAYRTDHIAWAMRGPGGSDVVYAGTTYRGFFDTEDVLQTDTPGEAVLVRQTVLRCLSGSPEMDSGEAVLVDGIAYAVRDKRLEGDGAITAYWLARG